MQRTLDDKDIRDNECMFIKKDGTRFLGELNAAMIDTPDGDTKAFVVTIRDITERKKFEKEIIRTKRYLRNIINSAPQIIIAFNKKGKVTTWNKTAEILTGYTQREVINRNIAKLDIFDNTQNLLENIEYACACLLYTSPSPRDRS